MLSATSMMALAFAIPTIPASSNVSDMHLHLPNDHTYTDRSDQGTYQNTPYDD